MEEETEEDVEVGRKKKPKNKRVETRSKKKPRLTAAQQSSSDQMKRALEEDQYSASGSIVDTDSDEDEAYFYRGQPARLDRTALLQTVRKLGLTEPMLGPAKPGKTKKSEKKEAVKEPQKISEAVSSPVIDWNDNEDIDTDRDGSIFGQTTGSSNSTWVECDRCKKWRRLRGVVDEKKLPSKWYCSMNKNDPERARCSAPEEAYEATHTPESAADARVRKHLRVWVRRLQVNEAYESRQLMTRKKRAAASSSKEPYEWIRCSNPSCGRWRALLRCMDAKTNVIDRTVDGEWYCVMNTWDEKNASCAAPQENLPAVGCPPWVMMDD